MVGGGRRLMVDGIAICGMQIITLDQNGAAVSVLDPISVLKLWDGVSFWSNS